MILRMVDLLTEPALDAEFNEDSVGFTPYAAWIIDGGTSSAKPRIDPPSDARWLAGELSRDLTAQLDESPLDPVAALRGAISAAADKAAGKFAEATPPSASVGILAHSLRDPAVCQYVHLGDIAALYVLPGSTDVNVLRSAQRSRTEDRLIQEYVRLRRTGISRDAAQARILSKVEARRRARMNRDDGYWIASIEPRAADHAHCASVECVKGTRLLLASDGFFAAEQTFGVVTGWAHVINGGITLKEIMGRVRLAERSDPDCMKYPRLKPSDDASALLLEAC
jgi:hypothetical protein